MYIVICDFEYSSGKSLLSGVKVDNLGNASAYSSLVLAGQYEHIDRAERKAAAARESFRNNEFYKDRVKNVRVVNVWDAIDALEGRLQP